jgi:hypothetical protein
MKILLLIIISLYFFPMLNAQGSNNEISKIQLYVSKTGNDSWTGKTPFKTMKSNNGPFATIERAQLEIRKIKKNYHYPLQGITVHVSEGDFVLMKPLLFNRDDSGTIDGPVSYTVVPGNKVTLSGSISLNNWKRVAEPEVLKKINSSARDKLIVTDLKHCNTYQYNDDLGNIFLVNNGKKMTIARWPNEDYAFIEKITGEHEINIRGAVGLRTAEIFNYSLPVDNLVNEKEAFVHGYWFWDWADDRRKITKIDVVNHSFKISDPQHKFGYRNGQPFYVYNALTILDKEGEWCYDKSNCKIYFWPPNDEIFRPEVPAINSIIELDDASNILFEGFKLVNSKATAIKIKNSSHIVIKNTNIINTGSWGIEAENCQNCDINDNAICQVADGGISINGGDRKTLSPAHNNVSRNTVLNFGTWNTFMNSAIRISGVGNQITSNVISHGPNLGILIEGNDNLVNKNYVSDVCRNSNDCGAIYGRFDWTMRGNEIVENVIYNIPGKNNKGAIGIYLDDMFSGVEINKNKFYKINTGILVGGGRDIAIKNNIFLDTPITIKIDARGMGWASDSVKTTLLHKLYSMPFKESPWRDKYPQLLTLLHDTPGAPKGIKINNNIFCSPGVYDIEPKAKTYILPDKDIFSPLECQDFLNTTQLDLSNIKIFPRNSCEIN